MVMSKKCLRITERFISVLIGEMMRKLHTRTGNIGSSPVARCLRLKRTQT